ncbi:hypothetical protein GGS20DRAFT_584937 [Poronia punctata]|nr:hypothetical protein GGS20DRAFT_584937 [Poronia punctata]
MSTGKKRAASLEVTDGSDVTNETGWTFNADREAVKQRLVDRATELATQITGLKTLAALQRGCRVEQARGTEERSSSTMDHSGLVLELPSFCRHAPHYRTAESLQTQMTSFIGSQVGVVSVPSWQLLKLQWELQRVARAFAAADVLKVVFKRDPDQEVQPAEIIEMDLEDTRQGTADLDRPLLSRFLLDEAIEHGLCIHSC